MWGVAASNHGGRLGLGVSRHSQKLQSPHGGGLGAPCSLPGCWVWSRPSPISSAPRGAFPAEAPRSLQRCPAPRRDASQPQAEELVPAFWGQIWRFQLRLSLPAGRVAPRALQSRGLASAPAPAAACSSNAFIASSHPPSPLHAALGISHTAAGLRGGRFFYFFFFCGVGPCLRAGDCGTLRGPAALRGLQVLHGFSLLLRLFSCFISPPAEHEGRPQAAVLPTPAQPPVPIAVASGLCPARPEQPGDPQRGSTVAGAPLRRYK